MSEWSTVVKKNTNKKVISNKTLRPNNNIRKPFLTNKIKTDISTLFEEEYGDIIENNIKEIYYDIKPHTNLLDKVSYVDIEYFFYSYFDKEGCVKLPETEIKNNEDFYDEEYY